MVPASSPPGFWTRVLTPIAVVVGSLIVAGLVIVLLSVTPLADSSAAAVGIVVAELALLVAGVLLLRAQPAHEQRVALAQRDRIWADVAIGVASGVGLVIVAGIIFALALLVDSGLRDQFKDQQIDLPGAPWAVVLVVIALVVLAPLGEEMLFRVVLFRSLARRVPIGGAIALSSVLFAAAHADSYILWPRAIALALTGVGLALLYWRRGYWSAVAAHAPVNGVASLALLATS
jgi:membrane protease YdiL (CAAX protease family)